MSAELEKNEVLDASEEQAETQEQERIMDDLEFTEKQWNEFVLYLSEGVRPEWLDKEYILDDLTRSTLQESLDEGLSNQLIQENFKTFLSLSQKIEGHEIDEFSGDASLEEFDLASIEAEFSEGSLLDQMDAGDNLEFSAPSQFEDIDLDMPEFNDKLPTDDDMDSFKVQVDEDLEESNESKESLHNQRIEQARLAEQMEQQLQQGTAMAGGYMQGEQTPSKGEGALSALNRMTSKLASSGANLAQTLESVSAAGATWGAQKFQDIAAKVASKTEKVNSEINQISSLSQEQAKAHLDSLRGNTLSGNIGNMAQVMVDAREIMDNYGQVQGQNTLSLSDMTQQAKQSEDPKMESFWKKQIVDALTENGIELLIEDTQALSNANNLVESYLNNSELMSERLGENLGSHVGSELEAYSTELKDSESLLMELSEIAYESGMMDSQQEAKLKEVMEKLQETIKKLSEKLGSLFGPTAKATVAPGM